MADDFRFEIIDSDRKARCGKIHTLHGVIRTPAFMPVGTQGSIKGMYMDQVRELGSDVILGNTYHMMLRPGPERIARMGGLHAFIGWPHPILTDSGGFQVMSLANLRKITPQGVVFRSCIDGSLYDLSPERAIEIQLLLGSDICMQLDECIALPAHRPAIESAMELSLNWAERSLLSFGEQRGKALFGIVQGGDDPALRRRSVSALCSMNFRGYAIGGLAVGESCQAMLDMLDIVCGELPPQKPRYLMGVGMPSDILKAVLRGVDMFDCVMPTRAGRHGLAFTRYGKVNLRNARHADDPRPLDESFSCPAASQYSRAYLHHLIKSGEVLGAMLLSWNNLAYYQWLMNNIREAIGRADLHSFVEQRLHEEASGDIPLWKG